MKEEFIKNWDIRAEVPLVSVCTQTYNHVNFIKQCMDSILMQETDFVFELLLHDDASTDGTADIVREYAEKYPNIILPIIQDENKYSKGVKIAVTYQFPRARGKYIALCEGDDFWTDFKKLQKQVDVLEANRDCSLCFCRATVLCDNELQDDPVFPVERANLAYLVENTNFKTPSAMFRLSELSIDNIAKRNIFGSHFIFATLAERGDILYLNDLMVTYRIHPGGVWSGLSMIDQYSMRRLSLQSRITYFTYKKNWQVRKILVNQYIALALSYSARFLKKKRLGDSLKTFLNSFRYSIRRQHIKSAVTIFSNTSRKFRKKAYRKCKTSIAKIKGNGMPVYWWNASTNFGDLITPMLLRHYGYIPIHTSPEKCLLCSTGSLLEMLPRDYAGTILGTGFMEDSAIKSFPRANILAVRGNLTWRLLGSPQNVTFGDPGLLISRCLHPSITKHKYKIGIVPHYVDQNAKVPTLIKERLGHNNVLLIDVQRNPEKVARDIASCEYIFSSSLHGLVTADSLGIPNAWVLLSNKVVGKGFKFYDYQSVFGVRQDPVMLTGNESTMDLIGYTSKKPEKQINEITDDLERVFLRFLSNRQY